MQLNDTVRVFIVSDDKGVDKGKRQNSLSLLTPFSQQIQRTIEENWLTYTFDNHCRYIVISKKTDIDILI